ncbi:MAG: carbohydrate ABC transporter permease [Clostridia bacterium]|nr:carbohydrate ABC transporter permease [Clostridia bacterium]
MHKQKNNVAIPRSDKVFYAVVNVIMIIILGVVLVPIVNIIASSFSSGEAVVSGRVFLWPVDFSVEGYKALFASDKILTGYANTIFYTFVGTIVNIIMTMLAAYPLSRPDFAARNVLMGLFTFTMMFSGGIIPNYLLMMNLGLLDTRFSLIISGAISVYNMIIARTYFATNIPAGLREAGMIDGCSDFRFFAQIALPLSKPIIAVLVLFYAVSHWNSYFNAYLYLSSQEKFPLQLVMREILISFKVDGDMITTGEELVQRQNIADLLKYSLIVAASLPVWCFYPFVQKYFVQGIMIGSIKG